MPSQDMKIMHLLPHKEKGQKIHRLMYLFVSCRNRDRQKHLHHDLQQLVQQKAVAALNSFHGARSQTSLSSSFVSSTGIGNTGAGIADVADGRGAADRACPSASFQSAARRRPRRGSLLRSSHSACGPSGPYDECPLLGFAVPERIVANPPNSAIQIATRQWLVWVLGWTAPDGIDCARMRSLQISNKGDRPWNRLAELAWIHRNIFSSFMG